MKKKLIKIYYTAINIRKYLHLRKFNEVKILKDL